MLDLKLPAFTFAHRMRRVIFSVVALAAALSGYLLVSHFLWKKPAPPTVVAAPIPKPTVRANPSAQPLVQTPTHPAPAATPDMRRLAPPGVYYLVNRISVTTDSGVIGVNAGTKVLVLERQENGELKVTDGPDDFIVAASEITNDLDVVARIVRQQASAVPR